MNIVSTKKSITGVAERIEYSFFTDTYYYEYQPEHRGQYFDLAYMKNDLFRINANGELIGEAEIDAAEAKGGIYLRRLGKRITKADFAEIESRLRFYSEDVKKVECNYVSFIINPTPESLDFFKNSCHVEVK